MSQPLRIGVIGLDRAGMFLLECSLVEPAFQVVAVCDSDAERRGIAKRLGPEIEKDRQSLIARGDLDAIFLEASSTDRLSTGAEILSAGKDLIVAPPVAETVGDAATLFDAALSAGRRLIVWSPWNPESDFRMAAATLRSGLIGPPRLLRFERWEVMTDDEPSRQDALLAMLDELLALAGRSAETVVAAPLPSGGLTVTVRFDEGLVALLTLHASAATRFDHGWAIDAEQGGYAAGSRWVRTADGETYHLPADTPPPATLTEVLSVPHDADSHRATERAALRLIPLRNAVTSSLRTGKVVAVTPAGSGR